MQLKEPSPCFWPGLINHGKSDEKIPAMIRHLSQSQKPSISKGYQHVFGLKDSCHSRRNLAFPYHRHLKSSSPQMPVQDNEIIAGNFLGMVISVIGGKYCIPQPKTIRYALLLVNFFQKSRILAGCKLIGIAIELIWRHSLLF